MQPEGLWRKKQAYRKTRARKRKDKRNPPPLPPRSSVPRFWLLWLLFRSFLLCLVVNLCPRDPCPLGRCPRLRLDSDFLPFIPFPPISHFLLFLPCSFPALLLNPFLPARPTRPGYPLPPLLLRLRLRVVGVCFPRVIGERFPYLVVPRFLLGLISVSKGGSPAWFL